MPPSSARTKSAGESHPEAKFHLGSTYASMDPPQKEKAKRLLESFEKRACKGEAAKKFKEQCAQANRLHPEAGGADLGGELSRTQVPGLTQVPRLTPSIQVDRVDGASGPAAQQRLVQLDGPASAATPSQGAPPAHLFALHGDRDGHTLRFAGRGVLLASRPVLASEHG